jgi:dTMP kinase
LRGKFITFEGIDGSGKSTQMRMLASELLLRGFDVLTTCEPSGTPLGRRLREAFLETEETVAPLAELLLFAADRAQHVNFLVKPTLKQGKTVISDRYSDATFAYQGAGRGFSETTVNQIIELATDGLKPDLTLFFDLPIQKALLRTSSRNEKSEKKNRMDKETAEFYERVREAYLRIGENEPERFHIIDAEGSTDEVKMRVLKIVTEFLENI